MTYRRRPLEWALVAMVMGVITLQIFNGFHRHLTPDISIYLLHTRTFVQELDRYTASHDSKGIALVAALAPAVAMFGATMMAAAATQLVSILVGFFCLRRFLASFAPPRTATIVCLLAITQSTSFRIWGGNARPEDLVVGLVGIALLAALHATPRWLMAGGAAAALCAFTKTTLGFAPVVALLAGCAVGGRAGISSRLRYFLTGYLLAVVALLGWMALFDDLGGWYRQSIAWPFQYRTASGTSAASPADFWKLLKSSHLDRFWVAAPIGLAIAWFRGLRPISIISGAYLGAEFLRILLEGALWPYPLITSVGPLLVATALVGTMRRPPGTSALVWLIPLLLTVPLLPGQVRTEVTAFKLRTVERLSSPFEVLAEQMQGIYQPGESILVTGNDWQIALLMDAPRPEPVLPNHFEVASAAEQEAVREHYAARPPVWVVERQEDADSQSEDIVGRVDHAFHVQVQVVHSSPDSLVRTGEELLPFLPRGLSYRLEVDTGHARAWRLQPHETPQPDTPENPRSRW